MNNALLQNLHIMQKATQKNKKCSDFFNDGKDIIIEHFFPSNKVVFILWMTSIIVKV